MWAENADENMQRKKQYAQFMMLKIEDDKHVYVIYIICHTRHWWRDFVSTVNDFE